MQARAPPGGSPPSTADSRQLVATATRQFGTRFATWLEDTMDTLRVEHSKRTGKIRYVRRDGTLLLVLRPVDGFFSLAIEGARVLADLERDERENGIGVLDEVAPFIRDGKNVFAKHVVSAPANLRPSADVYITGGNGEVLAVGKAVLSGRDMTSFSRGIAVKVRHGSGEPDDVPGTRTR